MALRSTILGDDPALQACLIKDSAHVVPGARGAHVAKIQKALLLLDKARVDVSELRIKLYGPTTAAAVLAYKRKRRIINPAYQTTADDIVGKMTIARLDEELVAIDSRVGSDRAVCGSPGGGPVFALDRSRNVTGVNDPPLKRHGKSIRFIWQDTQAAVDLGGGARLLFPFVARALELMLPHGLDFAISDSAPFAAALGPVVPDFEKVLTGSQASCFSVREAAERVLVTGPDTLRVICCPFSDKDNQFNGVTDGGTVGGSTFPKFCLINVRKHNPDNATLLHEMLHAARVPFPPHDSDVRSVFAEASVPRDRLRPEHAEKLANADFASQRRRGL
jgi:hypothetical protein